MRNFKRMITALMLCICAVSAIAQSYELSGTVKDDTGEYLPGVNIVIKGTTNGTLSDIQGVFTINVQEGDVIEASFIGMEKQEIAITGQKTLDIVLGTDAELMQEVMVVAYGTSTKEAFTGAATVIGSEKMEKQAVANFGQSLQGKAANVMVTSSSGAPGTSPTVRIRGIGSMTAGSAPLYVVDGVATANGVSTINPDDIESTTILKDAAATSLYGSRAANGVIIITTKKGSTEESSIRFSSKVGITQRTSDGNELMNAEQYYSHAWQGLYNEAIYMNEKTTGEASKYASEEITKTTGYNPYNMDDPFNGDGSISDLATLKYSTDWRDAIYQTGITQDYSLTASGGSKTGGYYISLGYYDETGIVIGTDYTRYNLAANFHKTVKPWLKVQSKNSFTYSDAQSQATGSSAGSTVGSAELFNPTARVYNDDGSYDWDNFTYNDYNPVALVDMDQYTSNMMNFATSLVAEFSLPYDIKYTATGAVDYAQVGAITYYNPYHGNGAGVNGRLTQDEAKNLSLSITNLLSWSRDFGMHSLSAIAGHEGRFEQYEYLSAAAYNGLVPGNTSLNNFSVPLSPSSRIDPWGMLSFFSQANYDFQDKYYLSGSLRSDGSSRFGDKRRWGAFYSLGGAWRISEEDFFDVSSIQNLRLRASYGTSGNNNIGNNTWQALYGLGANYNGQIGIITSQLQNSYLTWESANKANIAIEASLFDALDVTLEYYNNTSDKLLFAKPYAPSRGYVSSMTNLGSMSNKGVELTLGYSILETDQLSWYADFNISTNKNEILSLTQDEIIASPYIRQVGGGFYDFYMREWAGVNPDNGLPMWYTNAQEDDIVGSAEPYNAFLDPNGSGRQVTSQYDEAERTVLGTALPDFTGNLNNTISYGPFTLDFSFYFSVGGQIYNGDYAQSMHDGISAANDLSIDALDAWTPTNTHTNVPRYISNNEDYGSNFSSRFLEDGSYLRLKTLSLSYNLPKQLVKKTFLSGVNVYVSSNNLFTWTNYKGFDPEVGLSGITAYAIPTTKSTILGLNVTF